MLLLLPLAHLSLTPTLGRRAAIATSITAALAPRHAWRVEYEPPAAQVGPRSACPLVHVEAKPCQPFMADGWRIFPGLVTD